MKLEFSAGGIVFKIEDKKLLILIAQHSQHHGWVFPKGFIGDKIAGESKEETATREVEEETGIKGQIIEALEPVTYWYEMDGVKRKKTVYYYIMKELGGDITNHDWEMEKVAWISSEKVLDRLTYPSDKQVWEAAKERIEMLVA